MEELKDIITWSYIKNSKFDWKQGSDELIGGTQQ